MADCGYACIATILGHFKAPASVQAIKSFVGSTERGLSIEQLQAAFKKLGVYSTAVAFDRHRASAFPCPGVVLLKQGHYVVLTKRMGDRFKVFDPAIGWQTVHIKHFKLDDIALGIAVTGVSKALLLPDSTPTAFWSLTRKQAFTRLGMGILALSILSQAILLSIPYFTQQAVDAFVPGKELSSLSMIAIAFMLIAVIGQLSSLVASFGSRVITKRLSLSLAGDMFDRLSAKSLDWFQARPIGYALTQYQAISALQQFYAVSSRSRTTAGGSLSQSRLFSCSIAAG